MYGSVLIANRGEIAIRIARTARRLGMRVVAVTSAADRGAPHTEMADEVVELAAAEPWGGYLDIGAIIAAAQRSGAECIHPGYGFLAENPVFAEACEAAEIAFIGPSAAAIRALGHKDEAKALMAAAGVPVLPGYDGADQGPAAMREEARRIGYPVMLKAVAGGGGKGMRKVLEEAEFDAALAACRREALGAFGDARMLIEKFVGGARHIEVQVMADRHGRAVHLFERECSLQRRHQKVIEEAPAPGLTAAMRQTLGDAAVKGALAAGYSCAGTMEFIAPADLSAFYFMEINTRLQVEHPVTELITGLDLVELQFRCAAGEHLPVRQEEIEAHGHAIEARLYAEDPARDFLPQTGTIHRLLWATDVPALRIDTGIREGSAISPHYDPMIAKLIVHGKTRREALTRLHAALARTSLVGVRTNQHFLGRLLAHKDVVAGPVTTGFIDAHIDQLAERALLPSERARAAATWAQSQTRRAAPPWDAGAWSLAGTPRHTLAALAINGEEAVYRLVRSGATDWQVECDGYRTIVGALPDSQFQLADGRLHLSVDGKQIELHSVDQLARRPDEEGGSATARAPMTGKITKLFAAPGDKVERGDPLLVIEAMKMEHVVRAGQSGRLVTLFASPGNTVSEGALLCAIEPVTASAGT
jgi:3-methylcrotonyl-CoA carboxylase alpha subunit